MNSWVIKIGGSLYSSGQLTKWLDKIAQFGEKNIVIVPGGGPFADQVRVADKQFKLDQEKSHLMAILAMQQYGTMLTSMCPSMRSASSEEKIRFAWKENKAVVWEPFDMVSSECSLNASWDCTSDSIAAWLASKMQINRLLLVKSTDKVIKCNTINDLAEKECVDKTLSKLIEEYKLELHVLHKSQVNEFDKLIEGL